MSDLRPGLIDWLILLPVTALMLFSIAFVYSASSSFADVRFGSAEQLFWNHAIRILVGLILMILVSRLDYRFWQDKSTLITIIAAGFLLLIFVMGTEIKGATRWINLGFISFQPSELAKYALVLHVAAMLAAGRVFIGDWRRVLMPITVWTCIICLLIALQPNLSTATVIFCLVILMLYLGGARILHLSIVGSAGITAAAIWAVSAEYRVQRIMSYLNNEATDAAGYQLDQALIAFGNGGIWGLGPGQSRQRDWFLPESYGDFIFSIVGEEYGFVGVAIVLMCFIMISWRGFTVARKAPDIFGRILAAGITATIATYAFVNAAVTCGLLPVTGLPMPFISYGGTSVFFNAAAAGILLNISSQAGVFRGRRKDDLTG